MERWVRGFPSMSHHHSCTSPGCPWVPCACRVGTGCCKAHGRARELSSCCQISQQEAGCRARAGSVPSPAPSCSCPGDRTSRSNHQLVLSLSGLPASRRLELKNETFPFPGASAPARGRERSREAPTPPAPRRLPGMLSAGGTTPAPAGSGTAHAAVAQPQRHQHLILFLCTSPIGKFGRWSSTGNVWKHRARSPGPKCPKSLRQQQDGATTRSTAEPIALARGLALHRPPLYAPCWGSMSRARRQ